MLKKPQQAQPQVSLHGHSREPSISSSPALTPDSEAGRVSRPSIHSVVSGLLLPSHNNYFVSMFISVCLCHLPLRTLH